MTPIQRVKYAVKVSVAYLLYGLGVLWVWQRMALRRKAVVLMYHRVLTRDEQRLTGSHPGIIVGRETFAKHMAFLKRRFTVLSLDEFADRLEREVPFQDSSCLITFDDGWEDNCTNALPILQRHGLPAVVFLPVNFIGGRRLFWQEALTHLVVGSVTMVRQQPHRRVRVRELLAPVHLESVLDLSDDDPRPAIIEAVRFNKTVVPAVMDAVVAGLADELGVRNVADAGVDKFLHWQQVETMFSQGVVFGGHGAEHRILPNVSPGEALSEICSAREVVESRLKPRVLSFSYPNGNWTPHVADMVKGAGFRLAFTTERGFVGCEDDRFTLRRVNIHEGAADSVPMFCARLVGLF
jgi:peptidoglycan/xylan/chitin deacetylase (PgdA/CDA1 family)